MSREDFKNILFYKEGKIAFIQLNRPKALNALCDDLMVEMDILLSKIQEDKNISVVVLKGSKNAFAAGADISEMKEKNLIDHINNDFIKKWESISNFKKPIIASVAGYALGGGCEIAMMCDIIIAAENAKFGQPEINLGTIPAAGGTQRLVKSIGKSKAMELVLTGKIITAKEAKEIGLISEVVSLENLEAETFDIAKKISEKSLPVLILAKEAVLRSYETSLAEGLRNERRLFQSTFSLNDQKEGMKAFLEKRKAKFRNN